MSDGYERPDSLDWSGEEVALYDAAAIELISVCRDKFEESRVEGEIEETIEQEEAEEQAVYLEPPASYDDSEGEWERIDLYSYTEGWVDEDGNDRVLQLEFNQFLTDEVEFIKRYTLRFTGSRYQMIKRFYMYLGYEKRDDEAWQPLTGEEHVAKDELNDLSSLVILANVD